MSNDGGPVGRHGALGMALRVSTEMVSGVLVGGVIGWLLDRWLGTSPWFLLLFFVLGSVAGIMNVLRTAREINANIGANGEERDS